MRCFSFFSLYNISKGYEKAKGKDKEKFKKSFENQAKILKTTAKELFIDYNASMDRKVFAALMEMYYREVPPQFHPELVDSKKDKNGKVIKEEKTLLFKVPINKHKGDFNAWAQDVYSSSIFTDLARMEAFLNKPNYKVLIKDPLMQLTMGFVGVIRTVYGEIGAVSEDLDKGNRLFIAGLREIKPNFKFYPDANSTMRMSYGKVMDYYPADAVYYNYLTTAEGILEKQDSTVDEFTIPSRLSELLQNRDYGRWADDKGRLVVCFISDNDITGGNSGSPVINAKGELVGCAFDGNWEAMSGDIAFEPELQRTINVDIRYVLFIIDKLAGANHLIREMTLVE
jgi:hypothetical protein